MVTINEALTVNLKLKTDNWNKGIKQASQASKNFAGTVILTNKRVGKSYRDASGRMRDANGKFIKESKKGFGVVGKSIRKVIGGFKRLGKAIFRNKKATDSYRDANGRLRDANGRYIKDAKRGFFSLRRLIKGTIGLAKRLGRAFLGIGAVLAGGAVFGGAFSGARAFDKAIREVMTIVPEGTKTLEEMSTEVKDLAIQMGEDAPKAARAMYQAISAGVDAKNAKTFLKEAGVLAAAGVTSLETSVDLLTSTMNAFGISIDQTSAVSDVFFTTVKQGKTTVDELASVIGRVAPTAAATGVKLEEASAAISSLTAAGVNTATAGVQFTAFLQSVAAPGDKAKATAARLGIELSATALKAKGLAGFIRDLKAAAGGSITDLAALTGNSRALNFALGITGKAFNKFNSDLKGIKEGAGAAQTAMNKTASGFSFKLSQIESAFKQGMSGVGKTLLQLILNFGDAGDQTKAIIKGIKGGFKGVEAGIFGFVAGMLEAKRGLILFKDIAVPGLNLIKAKFEKNIFSVKRFILTIRELILKFQEFQNNRALANLAPDDENFKKEFKKLAAERKNIQSEREAIDKERDALAVDFGAKLKTAQKDFDTAQSAALIEYNKAQESINKNWAKSAKLGNEALAIFKEAAKASQDAAKPTGPEAKPGGPINIKAGDAAFQKAQALRQLELERQGKIISQEARDQFSNEITEMLDGALARGVKTTKIQALSDFVAAKLDKGMPIEEIRIRFNQRLNDAITQIETRENRLIEKQRRKAEREETRRIKQLERQEQRELKQQDKIAKQRLKDEERTLKQLFSSGQKTGIAIARGLEDATPEIRKKARELLRKTFGGIGALAGSGGQISNVFAKLKFQSRQDALQALEESNRRLRQTLGFFAGAGFGAPINAGGVTARAQLLNDGGIVQGPNVNRDVVPARLTPGEFIVNRQAASAFLPLLQSINRQTAPQIANTSVNIGDINVNNDGGGQLTNEVIDDVILPRIRFKMRMGRLL